MTNRPLSKETITTIRELVLNGQTKAQVSRDLNIIYRTIWNHTKDIRTQKVIPKKLKEKIRAEVENGKSKYQVTKEYKISGTTVYGITKDLPSKSYGWSGIRGRTLDVLQEIVTKGYAFPPKGRYNLRQYMVLRKYFPTIRRASVYKRQIFYLAGKEDVAVRACLENTRKKIITYHELKHVTDIFGTDISQKEKETLFFKKRGNRRSKNTGVQKEGLLREKDDSFSFFYIRRYCRVLQDNY